jgi:hypothetical protein
MLERREPRVVERNMHMREFARVSSMSTRWPPRQSLNTLILCLLSSRLLSRLSVQLTEGRPHCLQTFATCPALYSGSCISTGGTFHGCDQNLPQENEDFVTLLKALSFRPYRNMLSYLWLQRLGSIRLQPRKLDD